MLTRYSHNPTDSYDNHWIPPPAPLPHYLNHVIQLPCSLHHWTDYIQQNNTAICTYILIQKISYVTGYAKRGLIHTSDIVTLKRHNFICK